MKGPVPSGANALACSSFSRIRLHGFQSKAQGWPYE